MTAIRCTGFANPLTLLYRSSLQPLRQPCRVTTQVSRCLRSTSSQIDRRSFMTFRVLCAKATSKATSPPPPPSTGTSQPKTSQPKPLPFQQSSYAQQLAAKSHPTTLYEGASQRGLLFSSYTACVTCLAGAGINSWANVYNVPEGLHYLVPVAFSAVSLMMAILGTRFALTPAYNVRSIKVLPSSSAARSRSVAGKPHSAASPPPVRLEIAVRRNIPIPGLPYKHIQVDPSAVAMKVPLYHPGPVYTASEKARMKQEEEADRKRQREYEMTHIMSAPFRHFGSAMSTLFTGIRQGLTGEGFAPIVVDGVRYKLDITDGYVLEEGRALDKVVRIDTNA
ncbi:hypothetical protein F4779DRAFT_205764 [Xylariaceae sp. FL0662B]|nr:hypothetical protein F4779DRAFT_205764 [Xylariaceae sp. FL0662B]